jgi:hypothetical protein
MTVLPVRSTRPAPEGAAIAPFRPTLVIVPRSTRNADCSIGALPVPEISRAPSYSTGEGVAD